MGCVTVLSICAALVSMSVVMTRYSSLHPSAQVALIVLISTEAAVAIVCLVAILCCDPGVIRRTPQTTQPLPPEAVQHFTDGTPLPNNIASADESGPTYCVRCFVWRAGPRHRKVQRCAVSCGPFMRCGLAIGVARPAHHCSTCNRCVRDFDHHCGFFGRCIAGSGLRGNMVYFSTIIVMGQFGVFTFISIVIATSVDIWGPPGVAVALGIAVGVACAVSIISGLAMCRSRPWRWRYFPVAEMSPVPRMKPR